MKIKPLANTLAKTTKVTSNEVKQTVEKAVNSVKHERFVNKNLPRISPKQGQINRLNEIQAPNKSTFNSIVGDNPTQWVEEAVEEGNARRVAITEHEARVANMPPPDRPKAVGISEKELAQQEAFKNAETYETQGSLFGSDEGILTSETKDLAPVYANEHIPESGLRTINPPSGAGSSATQEVSRGADAVIEGEGTLLQYNIPKSRITSADDLASSEIKIGGNGFFGIRKSGVQPGSPEYQKELKERLLKKYGNNLNYDPEQVRLNAALKKMEQQSAPEPPINENTAWGSTAKAALGTAVGGAALLAALNSSRGQQNNAQLYGQQPLY